MGGVWVIGMATLDWTPEKPLWGGSILCGPWVPSFPGHSFFEQFCPISIGASVEFGKSNYREYISPLLGDSCLRIDSPFRLWAPRAGNHVGAFRGRPQVHTLPEHSPSWVDTDWRLLGWKEARSSLARAHFVPGPALSILVSKELETISQCDSGTPQSSASLCAVF